MLWGSGGQAFPTYGEWYDDPAYGWVFAPAVPQYVPYSNGYWTFTVYGFTWVSYEQFGWATDHYGRWIWVNRWVWLPDTEWAPAWVEWRSGDGCLGWAPRGLGAVAYFPPSHWRFAPVERVFSTDLPYHSAHAVNLSHTRPISRYARWQGRAWATGPDELWLGRHHVAPAQRRPSLNQMGRLDARQREQAEHRDAALRDVYRPRHERQAMTLGRRDAEARQTADDRRQLARRGVSWGCARP